jgi:hypothetical protein
MHNDAAKVKQRGQINGIAMSSFGYLVLPGFGGHLE